MADESLTLPTPQLRRGMFVAALDRPWESTPFLLQGFLIDDDEALSSLRSLCSWVVVDPARSNLEALDGLSLPGSARAARGATPEAPRRAVPRLGSRRAAPARPAGRPPILGPAPRLAPYCPPMPADAVAGELPPLEFQPRVVLESPEARKAREARARALYERLQHRVAPLPPEQRSPDVPDDIQLVHYVEERVPLQDAVPRANQIARLAREAMERLAADIVERGELQLAEIETTSHDLTDSIIENPNALVWLVRVRDRDADTYHHGIKVAVYLLTLGRHLGFPPERMAQLAMTGLLLDVGKLFIDAALLRRPGPLSAEEFHSVKMHVDLGLTALTRAGALPGGVYDGIAQHHERIDGTGYPAGLQGTAITIEGRMAAIADSFAAMTSRRPYAEPVTAYEAMQTLYGLAGRSFQESLVEKFVQAVGIFPTGALVELSTGEVAVVIRHNRERRLEPHVLVLTYPDKRPLEVPYEIDLMMQRQLALDRPFARITQGLPVGSYGLDVSKFYVS